ncbi:MAG: hypothetical protein JWR69_3410 [Pedosphaera sp.]|nr:hypothetical protein [Pedosphaera sp.]
MVVNGQAGTNTFNFDTDPSGILTIRASSDGGVPSNLPGEWFANGGSTLESGVADQSTNGYLAITQTTPDLSAHGMRSTIVFDDFDNGLVVAGFTFSCDVRIGAGSSTPADGFSINFARDTDPAIFSDTFGAGPDNNPPNGQEEGTTTGLAISFDAFQNGSAADVVGLTIKADNVVLTNIPMPNFNRACADATSLQTGTNDPPSITNLCWQPLSVKLQPNGLLSVSYKNVTLLTNFITQYTPSPGRLIFAGRTGGSYQEQDVDNISIITIASSSPVVGPTTGKADGFRFNIIDSGFATPDTNTITLKLDGAPVAVTAITQTGSPGGGNGVTIVGYQNTSLLFAPGSTHTNIVHFTGSTFNGAVDATNVFTVAGYTTLTVAQKVPGAVNTSLSGFAGRIHQLPVPRFPSATNLLGIERQLADGFIDPATSQPYVSTALVSTFTNEMINWNQDAPFGTQGGFISALLAPPSDTPDEAIPGIDPFSGVTDYVAAELLTVLDLPVGAYQLGVNHDDGFKLSVGAEPRDVFGATVLSTSAGAGDNSPLNIVVTNAGKYPFRLVWGEHTGASQLEFYLIDFVTGQKILINNRLNAAQIVAYSDTAALTRPYVRWVSPGPGEAGDPRLIVAKLQDGAAGTVIPGSVSLKLNGSGTASVSKSGGGTTATLTTATIPTGATATATLVYSTSTGGPFTNTWNFVISYFGQVMFALPLNQGAGTNIADTVWGLTGAFTTNNPFWTNDTPSRASDDFAVRFSGGAGRKALIVDTNKVISLGPDNSGANGDYTLQAWVKLPVGFEPAARMILFSYEGTPGFVFSINTGRTLHTTTFGLNDVVSSTVVPNDGEWHHVAVAHVNGVSMKFYLDGVLGSETAYTRGPGARTSFTVSVGGSVANQNNILTATLDRIKVTKGALEPGQFDYPIGVALATHRVGNTTTLSWPTTGGNLIPQSTGAISPTGTVWTDVPGTPTVNGNTVSLDANVGPGTVFFRLRPGP